MKLLYIVVISVMVMGVSVCKADIFTLPIDEDILCSFEKTDNPYSKKVWHTIVIITRESNWDKKEQAYRAYFWNSVWLTDEEFGKLVYFGEVKTKFADGDILIKFMPELFANQVAPTK